MKGKLNMMMLLIPVVRLPGNNYPSAIFEGTLYIDSVMLETSASSQDDLTITSQTIGVAARVTKFPRLLDGILGLGRREASSITDQDGNRIPPVWENLYAQGTIKYPAFGIYFLPHNVPGVGEISFGYYNEDVITSGLNYVPMTKVPPASNYWGIDASVIYGGNTILNPTAGIIGSGYAVAEYQLTTGATLDHDGDLTISLYQYENLQTLSIIIGGQSYDLTPNAQIWPRATPTSLITLVVSVSSDRLDLVLGHPFIQCYYVVFNATSFQIGFSSTRYTASTTN
ncbi:hypothetical protein ID866_8486 [Astraeus odoratus]|nr:hypothetical protein ID866_8486 [Astraeus odoratus]